MKLRGFSETRFVEVSNQSRTAYQKYGNDNRGENKRRKTKKKDRPREAAALTKHDPSAGAPEPRRFCIAIAHHMGYPQNEGGDYYLKVS